MNLNFLLKGIKTSLHRNAFKSMNLTRMAMSDSSFKYSYETLLVSEPSKYVFHVEFNRPNKANSMTPEFWREIRNCFDTLSADPNCRVVVISGKGKHFTAGLDLNSFADVASKEENEDIARKARKLKDFILQYQASFTALEKCHKPVICAVHSACIGGGVDLICAADIRYCSSDAYFQIKEVDLGLAADVGTLQRLPKIIGNQSLVRELSFTGRKFTAEEAVKSGLVSGVFSEVDTLIKRAIELACLIAEKSPVAVQASKDAILHARDHSVDDSLNYIATMNMSLVQSEDVINAVMAQTQKKKATFSKL